MAGATKAVAKKKENIVLFDIEGFQVEDNSVYRVIHKVDYDAPNGFVKRGISKIPGTGDSFEAPFTGVDPSNPKSGRWDLGFHTNSWFYRFDEESVRKQKVTDITKKVLDPFIRNVGTAFEKEDLVKGKEEFFKEFRVRIKEDDVFDTSNPDHVFRLYVALLQRKLAPKGRESESTFANAQYAIENLTSRRTRANEVASNKFEATTLFGEMIKTDLAHARALLIYMGERVADSTDVDLLKEVFVDRIYENPSKVEAFLENAEKFSSIQGANELLIFNYLSKAIKKPSSKANTIKGQVYYGDVLVGVDIKTASANIAAGGSEDLQKIQQEILTEHLTDENT